MKRFTVLAAACVVLAMGTTSQAVIVFQDNFDSYFDGLGNPNQAAFTAVWTPIGCTGAGSTCTLNTSSTVSNEVSRDFWDLNGESDPHAKAIKNHSPTGSPGANDLGERNQITFPASPTVTVGAKLNFSFDFYDLSPTAAPYRQYINLQSSLAVGNPPAGQLVSMGLNNNQAASASGGNYYMARILGYTNAAVDPDGGPNESLVGTNYVKLNDHDPTPLDNPSTTDGPGARGTDPAWRNLKVEISTANGVDTDFNFYVDNVHVEHVNVAGSSPRTYSAIRMGSGLQSNSDAYFDNLLVEFIPAAAGVLGDFNSDTKVDALDYIKWRKEGANPLTNDGGAADQTARYNVWLQHFGVVPGSASSLDVAGQIPEPTSIGLVLIGMTVFGIGGVAGPRSVSMKGFVSDVCHKVFLKDASRMVILKEAWRPKDLQRGGGDSSLRSE